ncbi:MAG: serine/threonine-protein phosphatase [Chloroflexi bacterium]|nr:serine/threonine-protein phosphatase [Chloroflexota bacterium]
MMGDVCGKGVGAALFMTLFRIRIRASANVTHFTDSVPPPAAAESALVDDEATLKSTITLTNNYVARTHRRASMFASLFLGLLNPATGSLLYVNGGHEAPLILGPAGVKTYLEPTGPVVGIFPNMEFKIQQAQLDPGDILLAFTDGVTDALNPAGEMFTRERLAGLLEQPFLSASALLQQIETDLRAHVAGADQFDDITIMAVGRTPGPAG